LQLNPDPFASGGPRRLAESDFLSLIAELAAAFMGFSLVVGLLQPDDPAAGIKLAAMRGVAELALVAALAALLPLLLEEFELVSSTIWRSAGGIAGMSWLVAHLLAARRFSRFGGRMITSKSTLLIAVVVTVGILLFFSASLLPGSHAGAFYCAATACALVCSAFLFLAAAFPDVAGQAQPRVPPAPPGRPSEFNSHTARSEFRRSLARATSRSPFSPFASVCSKPLLRTKPMSGRSAAYSRSQAR